MKKRLIAIITAAFLILSAAACSNTPETQNSTSSTMSEQPSQTQTSLQDWTEDSPAMKSIMAYVSEVTDEKSDKYVPEAERIAVFDSDGTLYGELFPTYVDQCLMIHRLVHDDTYQGIPEDADYCRELEKALLNGTAKPKAPRSSGDIIADAFKGFTVEEYREYVRNFMSEPVAGFEGMTYADGYYKPMISLVKYPLGKYIPSYQILGTRYGFTATEQGDTKARDYTPTADDKITFDGTVKFKDLKLNKVISIINDLGISPLLAFGNSSGDLAMAQYVMQHGGKAYMLLCDDTQRDHGDTDVAASFKADCDKLGIETVSMKNEFATIYGDFALTPYSESKTDVSLAPAA